MKAVGIEIKSSEAILVVLEKQSDGKIVQTNECIKFGIDDSESNSQVRQFFQQVNASLDNIKPTFIAIVARNGNAKGILKPSPFSFKLEGLFQLYDKKEVEFVWPQTISSYLKKNTRTISPSKKYQEDAFNLAYYMLNR
jgi:hypothetical protein